MTDGLGDKEKQIGQQVRRLRTERGMSQQKLADQMAALGGRYERWRQSTVDKTEKGQRPLRVNEMFDLAGVLGVPPEVLLAFDIDAEVLDSQIADSEALLEQAKQEHARWGKQLREYIDTSGRHRSHLEAAERDTALRVAKGKATVEVLYRLRSNISGKAKP